MLAFSSEGISLEVYYSGNLAAVGLGVLDLILPLLLLMIILCINETKMIKFGEESPLVFVPHKRILYAPLPIRRSADIQDKHLPLFSSVRKVYSGVSTWRFENFVFRA